MRTRLILGTVMIALILGLLLVDHLLGSRAWISSLIFGLGVAGYAELSALTGIRCRDRGGSFYLYLVGLVATMAFLAIAWCEWKYPDRFSALLARDAILAVVAGTLFFGFSGVVFRRDHERGFQPLLCMMLGALLFGLLFSYLLRIYQHPDGTLRACVFFLGIKGNDIAAYLVGRAIGRVRFLAVSPKKSLEGCLAAVLFSAVWFAAAGALWPQVFFPWSTGIVLGIILSFTTQVGDLSESLIKRCYHVKDSSALLPEFGGILDLVDSVLFSGYLFWLVEAPWS